MKQSTSLNIAKWGLPILAGCICLYGWYLKMKNMGEAFASDNQFIFIAQSIIIYFVLMIPFGLWYIQSMIKKHKLHEANYGTYALLRVLPCWCAICLGAFLYIVISDTSMLYCALIGAIMLLFVWPTDSRMEEELKQSKGEE